MMYEENKNSVSEDLQAALDDAEKTLRELQSKRDPAEQRVIKQMLEKKKRNQSANRKRDSE